MLLDALNRHRGKGQQKITVEHVHVHSGGQAVVGIVEAPGGGVQPKSEDQPNGKRQPPCLQIPTDPATARFWSEMEVTTERELCGVLPSFLGGDKARRRLSAGSAPLRRSASC
jgi:hypothetical protein